MTEDGKQAQKRLPDACYEVAAGLREVTGNLAVKPVLGLIVEPHHAPSSCRTHHVSRGWRASWQHAAKVAFDPAAEGIVRDSPAGIGEIYYR
jgi:hypothetical protein